MYSTATPPPCISRRKLLYWVKPVVHLVQHLIFKYWILTLKQRQEIFHTERGWHTTATKNLVIYFKNVSYLPTHFLIFGYLYSQISLLNRACAFSRELCQPKAPYTALAPICYLSTDYQTPISPKKALCALTCELPCTVALPPELLKGCSQ